MPVSLSGFCRIVSIKWCPRGDTITNKFHQFFVGILKRYGATAFIFRRTNRTIRDHQSNPVGKFRSPSLKELVVDWPFSHLFRNFGGTKREPTSIAAKVVLKLVKLISFAIDFFSAISTRDNLTGTPSNTRTSFGATFTTTVFEPRWTSYKISTTDKTLFYHVQNIIRKRPKVKRNLCLTI